MKIILRLLVEEPKVYKINFNKEQQSKASLKIIKYRTRVVRHIGNIYKDNELDPLSTSAENAQVQIEGGRTVNHIFKIYNLDMIISVGYRVKSKQRIRSQVFTWFFI